MRIFVKKAFLFKNRETGQSIKTAPLSFSDVPEWVMQDPIFALAKQDGDIESIESKVQEKILEKDAETTTKKTAKN